MRNYHSSLALAELSRIFYDSQKRVCAILITCERERKLSSLEDSGIPFVLNHLTPHIKRSRNHKQPWYFEVRGIPKDPAWWALHYRNIKKWAKNSNILTLEQIFAKKCSKWELMASRGFFFFFLIQRRFRHSVSRLPHLKIDPKKPFSILKVSPLSNYRLRAHLLSSLLVSLRKHCLRSTWDPLCTHTLAVLLCKSTGIERWGFGGLAALGRLVNNMVDGVKQTK